MLVERHWRVKVTDFNLSRMVQTTSPGSSIASLQANNPRWLAPEVGLSPLDLDTLQQPMLPLKASHRRGP